MIFLNNLEIMEQEAADRGIEVIDYYFESNRIKALYKNGIIAMNIRMRSYRQRACILAEEIAHHDTNVGNILDQTDVANRKQVGNFWVSFEPYLSIVKIV